MCTSTQVCMCVCAAYVILNEDDEMTPRKKRRSKTEDDDLWMPGGKSQMFTNTYVINKCLVCAGTVKLLSGSIASGSRPSRPHARKHSVDKKTTKIAMAKWVKKQGYTSTEEKPDIKYLVSGRTTYGCWYTLVLQYRRACMVPQ